MKRPLKVVRKLEEDIISVMVTQEQFATGEWEQSSQPTCFMRSPLVGRYVVTSGFHC